MAVPFAGLDSSVTLYPLRIALHLGLGGACPQPLCRALAFPGSAEAVMFLLLVCVFASTSACAGGALERVNGQKSGCRPGTVPGRHCPGSPPGVGRVGAGKARVFLASSRRPDGGHAALP